MALLDNPVRALVGFNKAVTTAGTQVQITSTPTSCSWVVITAAPANTGKITVSGSDADATADAEVGVSLAAGDTISIPIADLSAVWVDATVSGDEVSGFYGTQ